MIRLYQVCGEFAGKCAILVQPNRQWTRLLVRTCNILLRSNSGKCGNKDPDDFHQKILYHKQAIPGCKDEAKIPKLIF